MKCVSMSEATKLVPFGDGRMEEVMRKLAAVLLAASMVAGLAGCTKPAVSTSEGEVKTEGGISAESKEKSSSKEPITLKLWAGIQPEYGYDMLVKNFNEEFADKGIQLEYTRYVNDGDGNLQLDTYLLGSDDVDIFIGYGGLSRLEKRAEANLLLDMTPYLEARSFDAAAELGENNIKSFEIDGKYYCLPTVYGNNNWIVANVDMFKEAGIELPTKGWTYSQFQEAAEKLTQGEGLDKIYGMFWWLDGGFNSFAGNMGAVLGKYQTYSDDSCKTTSFDNPVFVKELEMVRNVMDNGWSPSYADEKSDQLSFQNMFLAGKAAMSFGVSQLRIVKDLETYPHDFTTAPIPFPVPDESYLDQANYSGIPGSTDLISVNAKSKHIEEAMDFVLWYIKGGMAPLAKGGRIPLWKDFDTNTVISMLNENPGVFDEDALKEYLSIDATNAYSSLTSAHSAEISDIKNEGYQAALLGEKTAAEAMKDIKARCDALLAQ